MRTATLAGLSLFPIRVRYALQCSGCLESVGTSPYPIGAAEAKALLAAAPGYG